MRRNRFDDAIAIAKMVALCMVLLSAGWASAAQLYSIRPLDMTAGHFDVFAKGINNRGQVVGYTIDAQGNPHAALWDDQGIHPLPSLSASTPYSEAYGINDSGQIAGKAVTDRGQFHAVFWDDTGITDIGVLEGGTQSFAQNLNASGVVVGSSETARGSHAFTWTKAGGFVDYGNLDTNSANHVAGFNGVNNKGLFVGTGYMFLTPFQAIMAREGDKSVTNISPPAQFSNGMALAVNDAGTIVGYQNPGSGSPEAAIFNGDATYQKLGLLGLDESWAQDINESGVIVGRAFGYEPVVVQKAFVYQNGEMTELLRMLEDSSGWDTLFEAASINDVGQIVGVGTYRGEVRAFIATPVPEPAGLSMAAMALLCTHPWWPPACRRRRCALRRISIF
jgi:probable HAF family extracellular repeat protein